jgi:hypothetical protein
MLKDYFPEKIVGDEDKYLSPAKTNKQEVPFIK